MSGISRTGDALDLRAVAMGLRQAAGASSRLEDPVCLSRSSAIAFAARLEAIAARILTAGELKLWL